MVAEMAQQFRELGVAIRAEPDAAADAVLTMPSGDHAMVVDRQPVQQRRHLTRLPHVCGLRAAKDRARVSPTATRASRLEPMQAGWRQAPVCSRW